MVPKLRVSNGRLFQRLELEYGSDCRRQIYKTPPAVGISAQLECIAGIYRLVFWSRCYDYFFCPSIAAPIHLP